MMKPVSDAVCNVTLYIGPGLSMLLMQIAIAASVGALTMLGIYRAKVTTFIRWLRRK